LVRLNKENLTALESSLPIDTFSKDSLLKDIRSEEQRNVQKVSIGVHLIMENGRELENLFGKMERPIKVCGKME
jgi:hypothetical protein